MDFRPLYRRPRFQTAVGLLVWLTAYLLLRRGTDTALPLPLPFAAAMALLSTLALVVLLGQLLPPGRRLVAYPGEVARFLIIALWIALHVWALRPHMTLSAQLAVHHADLFLATLFFMIALSAQFVLPVRTLAERATIVGLLLRHMVGLSGPVVFVHNGRARETSREDKRRGPGVLLVDHASAAVLRTDVRFTGAVGPGLTFTAPGERLAEPLDLRCQVRTLPATPPTTPAEAEQLAETSLALTRDGIPVSAELRVTFMLHPGRTLEPRLGSDPNRPPYDFFPIAAGRAVYGHAFGPQHDVPWTRLPLLLAVDLWREEVKARSLLDLLRPPHSSLSPLEEIERAILDRLTSPTYSNRDREGRLQWKPSREYRLLHERGVRVLDLDIHDLILPEDVRQEHLLRWRETWSGAVRDALRDAEHRAEERRRAGRRQAVRDLSDQLTQQLRGRLTNEEPPNRRDTLATILLEAIRLCDQGDRIPEGPAVAAHLKRMRSAVLSLDSSCLPRDSDAPS